MKSHFISFMVQEEAVSIYRLQLAAARVNKASLESQLKGRETKGRKGKERKGSEVIHSSAG